MERDEPAAAQPIADRDRRQPGIEQLSARNDAVLPLGKPSDHAIRWRSGALGVHIAPRAPLLRELAPRMRERFSCFLTRWRAVRSVSAHWRSPCSSGHLLRRAVRAADLSHVTFNTVD
ncbi:hypothetical protein [Conexibacter arvalis]|uniref:Uncharacterized protein n=1 Tax=Conexibacter arvalis TaxID=912552 RepID=A0A840IH16_9ACTN|nr:hypothetical protein [Conexibacter arvalis]MBB4663625.1 hypothetical protein [Conexibacter arvalis]